MKPSFLTAEWRHLAMLNFAIDPAILKPLVPAGTELDFYNGVTFVSIVGFQFLKTRVLGIPFPFHQDFEEVNLRFYVRRKEPGGWRRGVVFVSELVPKHAIAWVARVCYGEPYSALPMRNKIETTGAMLRVNYEWQRLGKWESVSMTATGEPQPIAPGSEEEFITEHYWGYTPHTFGTHGVSSEYQVEHPSWRVWQAVDSKFDCDVATLYGPQFVDCLSKAPSSAFIAEGSGVTVRFGSKIRASQKE